MMKIDKIVRVQVSLSEAISNMYDNAARFCWSSKELNDYYLYTILKDPNYSKLPNYAKEYLKGYHQALDSRHFKLTASSYIVKGKRLVMGSKEYRKISPGYISEHCLDTYARVYSANTDKVFF